MGQFELAVDPPVRAETQDPHRYRVMGLSLGATSPIEGLAPAPSGQRVDVRVDLRRRGPWWDRETSRPARLWRVHPETDETGRPAARMRRSETGDWHHLIYADGTEFVIERDARRILGAWNDPFTAADAVSYLVGPVLGFAMRLRGGVSLHASAVVVDGGAVAFLGTSGAGKSTIAAAFARRGHEVLCDDSAALACSERGALVMPGARRVRLWPDSVAALFGAPDHLPRLTPNWDKRYLDLAPVADRRNRDGVPLTRVYVLEPRTQCGDGPRILPVPPRETLLALLGHSYVGYFQDTAMLAREFTLLSDVARRVSVRRFRPPSSPDNLDELCEAITRDVRAPEIARDN